MGKETNFIGVYPEKGPEGAKEKRYTIKLVGTLHSSDVYLGVPHNKVDEYTECLQRAIEWPIYTFRRRESVTYSKVYTSPYPPAQ